jgi:hypothetical protein
MPRLAATAVYCIGIWIVFALDRDRKSKTSWALWLATAWLLISGSRPISAWLYSGSSALTPEQLLDGSPLDAGVRLGLIVGAIAALVSRRKSVNRILHENGPMLLFLFYCAVSTLWSDYPAIALKRWIRLLGDFTMVLLVLTESDRSGAVKRVLSTVGFILIPVSIMLDKYYPEYSRYYDPWTGRGFVSGVAADKNMLGMTCLVYGIVLLWRLVTALKEPKSREKTRRLVVLGGMVAMVIYLFRDADSMTSESCFFMGGALIVATAFWKFARKPLVVHLMVLTMVGAAFGLLFLHIGGGVAFQKLGRNATLTGRTEIWAGLLRFSGNPLIGTGFDSFWMGTRMERIWAAGGQLYGINEAHDGYLEIYLNLGWVGIALLGTFIVTGYRNILAALRIEPEMGRIRLGLFVAVIVYSFTEAGFRTNSSVWIAFLLAIAAVPSRPTLRLEQPPIKGSGTDLNAKSGSRIGASSKQQLIPRKWGKTAVGVSRTAT